MSESADQLYDELHSVIRRYQQEGELSGFLIIGALEAVKADALEMLVRKNYENE